MVFFMYTSNTIKNYDDSWQQNEGILTTKHYTAQVNQVKK